MANLPMNDPLFNANASSNSNVTRQPENRRLLIILGVAILALLLLFALWRSTGTHGAQRDLSAANAKVSDKQKEVDDALRTYQQRVAELRALRASADVEATKLDGAINQQVQSTVNDARVDVPVDAGASGGVAGSDAPLGATDAAPDYYIRDRHGRFVRVTRR